MKALDTLYEQAHQRLRFLPSLLVLAVVLVLLHGLEGAVEMLQALVISFFTAIVGGGDHSAVTSVLWRTLPLALAAGGMTFVVASRWIEPGSSHSYVWLSLIVLAAAIVGNACYEQFGSTITVVSQAKVLPATQPSPQPAPQPITVQPLVLGSPVLGSPVKPPGPLGKQIARSPTLVPVRVGVPVKPSAWQRIRAIRWFEQPDLSRKPHAVEPLEIVPTGPGILRGVTGAVNQLLGYLVDYEPRLFFASIIAGSFVGWRLQRKVALAHAVVSGDFSDLSDGEVKRLAA